ncbi:hypothetical protein [Maridesulfovibrio zosterae]|uniref:hypothetical protein n=1 Tax=Maridesulfovibrio zosterae TaxID=82171 RepID=UPI0004268D3C|nr:hypothetical protein [Maridesulfovibrio zosterae]
MSTKINILRTANYLLIAIITFLVLQSCIVVIHEFTHRTTAWLLGEVKSPVDIVWGNPITMTGWDEGVEYTKIFSQGRGFNGAVIGIAPIIMHTFLLVCAIWLMCGDWLFKRKWIFHAAYWLSITNFMELIAYVYMRAFSGHGDLGNFDVGMNISPWWIFIIGSVCLTLGLWFFFSRCLPRLQFLFAPDNIYLKWSILILSTFLLFLWGSGIRVMAYVSGPQWTFGLIGIPAVLLCVWLFRPSRYQL